MNIITLIYLLIVAAFIIFSLLIVYHLFRFGVNKTLATFVTLLYAVISFVIIVQGLIISLQL